MEGETLSWLALRVRVRLTFPFFQVTVYSSGTPLQPNRAWRRNAVQLRHLDELARRVRKLEGPNED